MNSRIGIDLADLRMETKSALRRVAAMQFNAVELPAAHGETTPEALTASGRRHLATLVKGLGISLASLTADFPGMRLSDPATADERVARTCAILELAADLRTPVVTAAVGALTHPQTGAPSPLALAALERIADVADSRNVVFALRPSHDSAERVAKVLETLGCPMIQVGLDPAAMVMSGNNPIAAIDRLPSRLALVHIRDAVSGRPDRPGHETRAGEGEVDLRGLIASLQSVEYRGSYILRRTEGATPASDLETARDFTRRLL